MVRMVNCVKLGRELPGLEKPPFPGELGQRIFDNVSAQGYALWQPHMTILINHYALNPADPETRRLLRREMDDFFFGENALVTENLSPPNAAPTKGGAPQAAPTKGGEPEAAPSKGGGAPRRK
ncbi:MAG TPA: oxidative damage protection protein [Thermomicrobiales bacterium]|nr:oxidative damage protection protein [Thermomicrobiales bacterium]